MAFFCWLALLVDLKDSAMACDPEANLEDTIRLNAQGPAKVSGDAGSVEQQKLTDLIAADKYLSEKCAVEQPRRGLRFNKFVPPGAA